MFPHRVRRLTDDVVVRPHRPLGNQLGELRNATARSLRFPLNRTPTFNFTIKADNPFASLLVDLDKVLVKAYDDSTGSKVLRFYGPCVGRDKTRNAQEGTIPISAPPGCSGASTAG
jgi:hypothetical protein